MSYVDNIVKAFGGIRPMARAIAKPTSTVASWVQRQSIPDAAKPDIMTAALRAGLGLRREDFAPALDSDQGDAA